MMKKLLFTLALAGMSSLLLAQNETNENFTKQSKYQVLTNPFGSNWFITVNGGAQTLFGDYDEKGSFGKRITPSVDLAVGKWFTPGLGLRFTGSWSAVRGFGRLTDYAYDLDYKVDGIWHKEYWSILNFHGDIMFNLTNMICGYDKDRLYHAVPYVGFGVIHSLDNSSKNNFGVNFGFLNTFRLNDKWDFNVEAKALVTNDNFDLVREGCKVDAIIGLSAGFTYKFAPREFRKTPKVAPVKQLISEAELKELQNKLATLAADNNNLKEQLKNKPTTIIKEEKALVAPRAVFFSLGSAVVSQQEVANLGFQADRMKEHSGLRYKVIGYGDSATGSATINQTLSEKRAQAVIDILVSEYGISRSSLVAEGRGGVDKYSENYLNRMAVIEVIK